MSVRINPMFSKMRPVETELNFLEKYIRPTGGSGVTSYTFSNVDFGADAPKRYALVSVHTFDTTNGLDISSVTIGGVTATRVIVSLSNPSQNNYDYTSTGIFLAEVSGQYLDVEVTNNIAATNFCIGSWSLITEDPTPIATFERDAARHFRPNEFTTTWGKKSLVLTTCVDGSEHTPTNASKEYTKDFRSNELAQSFIGDLVEEYGTITVDDNDVYDVVIASWA